MSRGLLPPGAAVLSWRLCGVLDLVKVALLAAVDEGLLENWEVLVSRDAAEAFLRFDHASCGPVTARFENQM